MQLTDELKHLTMTLQSHPIPQPNEEPVNKAMQAYMDTWCATQREENCTITMLKDIPSFNGQDSSKLKDWFMDIETAIDILTESCIHLPEAKLGSLTHRLIHKALQAGTCCDEIKGIHWLMFCNANIHTYI